MLIENPLNCDNENTCADCPHTLCPDNNSSYIGNDFAVTFDGWRNGKYIAIFDAFEYDRYFYLSYKGIREVSYEQYIKMIQKVIPERAGYELKRVKENHEDYINESERR